MNEIESAVKQGGVEINDLIADCKRSKHSKPVEGKLNNEGNVEIVAFKNKEVMQAALVGNTGAKNEKAASYLIETLLNSMPVEASILGDAGINKLLAAMHDLNPKTSSEGLICSQMVVSQEWIKYLSKAAVNEKLTPEQKARYRKDLMKMMGMSLKQAEVLSRLRSKEQQVMTVQHVTVNEGGRAVVGKFNEQEKR